MKKLAAVFVTATLLLNAMAPTLAQAATYLQGTQVNANTLIQAAYVAVTYYDSKNKQTLDKGWIDAIDETSFTIRNGLWGKKTIAYDKILSLVMSEEATTLRQINEVNRWFRGNMAERGIETEQVAIQLLNQKTVTIMSRGQIDPSEIIKGWYAHVVYTSQGATGSAISRIADKDSSHIGLKYGFDTHNIAYNDIDTLIVAKHLREIERYRETGAKYNVRVRVYAPSIQKGQMIGKLIKMMQDTLVIQAERVTSQQVRAISSRRIRLQESIQQGNTTLYQVPITAISHLEVSMGQYRNTSKGLKIGLATGLGVFVVSYAYAKNLESRNPDNIDGLAVFIFGTIAAPSAFVISTLIGAITKSDKWVEVSPQRLNLSLAPTSTKGLRVALTFNF